MRIHTPARFLAAALTVVVVGCSGGAAPAPTPSPAGPTPTPARVDDTEGRYQLVFELPRTNWRTTDSIAGQATLSLIGAGAVDFGASGQGPLAFGFDEVGGSRHAGWSMTADCAYYHLDAGQSISSSINKSGGYEGDAAPSDFNRWFTKDQLVYLPAGDWTITAVANLVDGAGCSGGAYTLKAAVLVHVTAG